MFFEILLAIIIGVNAGIITGLIPGLHVNLVTVIIVGLAGGILSGVSPLFLAIGILALALTHSFLDSIPSIYLGAPDESQVLSVLPGHQMLLEGKGHQAILYTIIGSLVALILTLLFFPIGIKILEPVYLFIKDYVAWMLILVVIMLLIFSKKIVLNLGFFILSGTLGYICFLLPNQEQILLPLLTGLFGISTLFISYIGPTTSLPRQQLNKRRLDLHANEIERTSLRATIVGILAAFLPGFGSSQAAIMASATMKEKTNKDYLLLVGGVNTVNFSFSILTVILLAKARNGAIVGIHDLIGKVGEGIGMSHLLLFVPTLLIVGGSATLLGMKLSRVMARFMQRVNYKQLLIGIQLFLISMVLLLSGLQGIVILITATALGILANLLGAQKNMLLGSLLLPVILYLI